MPFNLVVKTNEASMRLCRKIGFDTVGILPCAFDLATDGHLDALIIYKTLVR